MKDGASIAARSLVFDCFVKKTMICSLLLHFLKIIFLACFFVIFLRPKRRATKFHEAWRKKCVEISYFRLFREENADFSMFLSIWGGICSKLLSRAEKVQRGSNGKPIRPVNRKTGKTEKEVPRKGSI